MPKKKKKLPKSFAKAIARAGKAAAPGKKSRSFMKSMHKAGRKMKKKK